MKSTTTNPQRKEKFPLKYILQQMIVAGMCFLNGRIFKVSAKTMGGMPNKAHS